MTASYVRQSGFVVLPNAAVHDRGLSLTALGLLAYLLALPPGAPTGYRDLERQLGIGQHVARRCLAELAAGGYRHVVKYQRADGTWRSVVVHGAEPFTPEEARHAAAAQSGDLIGLRGKPTQAESGKPTLGATSNGAASPQVAPSVDYPGVGQSTHVPTGPNTPTGYPTRARRAASISAPEHVRGIRCRHCGFLATEPDHECGTIAADPAAGAAKVRAALAAAGKDGDDG